MNFKCLALSGVDALFASTETKCIWHINLSFMPYAIYILECVDGTYYTGLTKELDARVQEHQMGKRTDSYTYSRRPVKLVWSNVTDSYSEAFQWERKIKGWSRAKKEALIRGDIEGIHEIVKKERKRRGKIKTKKNQSR